MGRTNTPPDLLPGTLDLLILRTLATRARCTATGSPSDCKQISDDVLQVEEGSLYPALQRLLLNGWVKAEWGASENNRRARFYKLTAAGRKQLGPSAKNSSDWSSRSSACCKPVKSAMHILLRRLSYFIRHRRVEAELAEELEIHRALEAGAPGAVGNVRPPKHGYASRRALGNITLAREDAGASGLCRAWKASGRTSA